MTKILTNSNRIVTASFFSTVSAGSFLTVVSKRISTPFLVQSIHASFALNTNRLLLLRFYVSPDDSAPTSSPLTGQSLLDDFGQVDYVTGDDESKDFTHQVFFTESGMYLKVFGENQDVFDHTLDCQIQIQLFGRS